MSPEWHKAAAKLFADQAKDVDIIITTALIPGRKAPLMITKEMVHSMKAGSVCVDLAAENGGNIETTVKDAKFVTPNGVTCLGYTDLPSRLPSTSSSLYSNNAQKFLSSVGPMTTKVKDYWHIDHEDVAVRGMLVLEKGKMMWPAPQPAPPAPPSEAEVKAKVSEEAVERAFEERRAAMNCAKNGYIRSTSTTKPFTTRFCSCFIKNAPRTFFARCSSSPKRWPSSPPTTKFRTCPAPRQPG